MYFGLTLTGAEPEAWEPPEAGAGQREVASTFEGRASVREPEQPGPQAER